MLMRAKCTFSWVARGSMVVDNTQPNDEKTKELFFAIHG